MRRKLSSVPSFAPPPVAPVGIETDIQDGSGFSAAAQLAALPVRQEPASVAPQTPAAPTNWRPRSVLTAAAVTLLLALFAAELISTVRQESHTWDEGAHIFAGYMTWKTFD